MRLSKITLLFVCFLIGTTTISAQSWRKLRKTAEQQYAEGNYSDAAETYEMAWNKKKRKKELIFKAGEAYYMLKDYRKAAAAYQNVKDEIKDYPMVGLKYARSLKQDGQYQKAIKAFRTFMDGYTGDGKAILQDVINTEVEGCELAQNLAEKPNKSVNIVYPNGGVNTNFDEFAPFAATSDFLYFSSAIGGNARIYFSKRMGDEWSKASIPSNFPVISNGHYANGSISPDGERFYFTVCNDDTKWDQLNSRCEIFVSQKDGTNWGEPSRLPDYINMEGVSTTQPYSIYKDGQEYLFFSSNREGGRGGMDIWFAVRDLGMDDNDFTFPVNLGPTINTLGDELSPYYDVENETLYFSSNGHVTVGGFDIFKSQGNETTWATPVNVGFPLNSSADDLFFRKNNGNNNGFFVSNRVFGGVKNSTRNTDIFEFQSASSGYSLKGDVMDRENGAVVNDIRVTLFQVFEDGTSNLLLDKDFHDGHYSFRILPNKSYMIQVESAGYYRETYDFSSDNTSKFTYGETIYLEREGQGEAETDVEPAHLDAVPPTEDRDEIISDGAVYVPPTIIHEDGNVTTDQATSETGVTYTARGTSKSDQREYITSAPKHSGVYYKIQLTAVTKFNPNHKKMVKAANLGRLDTEKLTSKNITRILLAEAFDKGAAKDLLRQAKKSGFKGAFIVKYEDGVRYGRVNL